MRHDLAIKLKGDAKQILLDFANARDFKIFRKRWEIVALREWSGGEEEFRRTQGIVRNIWRGEEDGPGEVARHLGLSDAVMSVGEENEDDRMPSASSRTGPPPIKVDWNKGSLFLVDRDLNDIVWLALLQHSKRLRICANTGQQPLCPTPYILKFKPKQRFCSEPCAAVGRREYKREAWRKHGQKWRKKKKLKSAGKRRS